MHDYRDIAWPSAAELHDIAVGRGAVTIARTARDRPIDVVTVGRGAKTLFVAAGVHGAERMNPLAVARLLRELDETPDAHADWLDAIRLVVMPLVNPDGYDGWRRANDVTWNETVAAGRGDGIAEPPRHYYTGPVIYDGQDYSERPGFDPARDLANSSQTRTDDGRPRWGFTIEARALAQALAEARQESGDLVFLDLHCQRDGYRPIGAADAVHWSLVVGDADPDAVRAAEAFAGTVLAGVRAARPGLVATRYPQYHGAPDPAVPSLLSEISGLPNEPLTYPIADQVDLAYTVLLSAIRAVAGLLPEDAGAYRALPETDR